jgi:hypothetical protein
MTEITWTAPLEWKLNWGPDEDGDENHVAETPFGSIYVERSEGRWKWRYCFDEYYDEQTSECDGLEDGKRLAQDFWDERVQPILAVRAAQEGK